MADKYKFVTIKEREFQVGKFGARDGTFIAMKVAGILAPMAGSFLQGTNTKTKKAKRPEDVNLSELNISALIAPLANISEGDFSYLQDKCLGVCKIKMPVGYIDLLNDNGSFAVVDLEEDSATVMALMVHTLIHNLSGFFDGSPLSGLLGGLLVTNPQR